MRCRRGLTFLILAAYAFVGLGGGLMLAEVWRSALAQPLRLATVAALIGLGALAAAGLAWPRRATEIATLLVTVSLGALAIDQYFGRLAAVHPRAALAREHGIPFDARWAPDVALDERAAGRTESPVYPSISAVNFYAQPLFTPTGPKVPLGHVAHARVVLCNELGDYQIVHSDRHGFINPDGVWDTDWRVAVVGDSFAEGWCVPEDRSFAALLRGGGTDVVNLGRGSLGVLGEVAVMREYLHGRRVGWVVWTFFEGNDWSDLVTERDVAPMAAYLDPAHRQGLAAHRDEVQTALSAYGENYLAGYRWRRLLPVGKWRSAMAGLALPWRSQPVPPVVPVGDDGVDWVLVRQVARLGIDAIMAAGARPIFVLLPSFETYPQPDPLTVLRRERLLALMRDMGAIVVDGDSAFRAAATDPRDFFPLRIWGHYTEAGHRVIADAISAAFKE